MLQNHSRFRSAKSKSTFHMGTSSQVFIKWTRGTRTGKASKVALQPRGVLSTLGSWSCHQRWRRPKPRDTAGGFSMSLLELPPAMPLVGCEVAFVHWGLKLAPLRLPLQRPSLRCFNYLTDFPAGSVQHPLRSPEESNSHGSKGNS